MIKMYEDSKEQAIEGIRSIIIGLKDKCDIVGLADSVGLGMYIPSQLRSYRDSDFNFDIDVGTFLRAILMKEELQSVASLFDEIYNLPKYYFCKRFIRNSCKTLEQPPWTDTECRKCGDFLSDGRQEKLEKYFKILGFPVTSDGFVVPQDTRTIDVEREVAKIRREMSYDVVEDLLPSDIQRRGREMSQVYTFLYCIENSLRLFIDKVFLAKLGDNYVEKIKLPGDIHKKIKNRKSGQEKNKWLSIRGNNDLFYLDLEDLGRIIQNNWGLFKEYFPDQNWIVGKIKEISNVRNLVAHNSYVKEDERDLLRLYYTQILKQLQQTLKPTVSENRW
jgi:hypothetical protein